MLYKSDSSYYEYITTYPTTYEDDHVQIKYTDTSSYLRTDILVKDTNSSSTAQFSYFVAYKSARVSYNIQSIGLGLCNHFFIYDVNKQNVVVFNIIQPTINESRWTGDPTVYLSKQITSSNFGILNEYGLDSFTYNIDGTSLSVNTTTALLWKTFFDAITDIDIADPYNGNDDSVPGGGDGDFNYDSDSDDIPDLPTVSIADSGFVTLYAPTNAQLKSLASYLWSDAFSIDTFKKMFNNPMDCILGLSLVPVNLPHGTAQEITVGNLVSTVSCDKCTSQYVYIECGSISINASSFTNSYLDFSPYTEISIYLPFIGTQPLDVDEIMNSTITVTYHVDVLTGAMCCFVKVAHSNPISGKETSSVLYTFMGQCCESVPLSSNSWSDTIGSILNAAASIGGVVATAATGGAAAPVALGMLGGATTATVNAAQSMKPTVNHSGSMGGGGGMMAQRTPKLIMKAPNISKPSKQYSYTGYPVNQTKALSACSGFTIVQDINLVVSDEGIGATQEELNEIERLLKTGVFI